MQLLHHHFLLLLQLCQYLLVLRVLYILLLHSAHIALLNMVTVLELKLSFALSSLLFRLSHLHSRHQFLGLQLSLLFLKICLTSRNNILGHLDIRAFLPLEFHS